MVSWVLSHHHVHHRTLVVLDWRIMSILWCQRFSWCFLIIILVDQDIIAWTKILPFFKILVFRAEILEIALTSSQMDHLKYIDSVYILLFVHTHLNHFQNWLYKHMLAPVKRNGVERNFPCHLLILERIFLVYFISIFFGIHLACLVCVILKSFNWVKRLFALGIFDVIRHRLHVKKFSPFWRLSCLLVLQRVDRFLLQLIFNFTAYISFLKFANHHLQYTVAEVLKIKDLKYLHAIWFVCFKLRQFQSFVEQTRFVLVLVHH